MLSRHLLGGEERQERDTIMYDGSGIAIALHVNGWLDGFRVVAWGTAGAWFQSDVGRESREPSPDWAKPHLGNETIGATSYRATEQLTRLAGDACTRRERQPQVSRPASHNAMLHFAAIELYRVVRWRLSWVGRLVASRLSSPAGNGVALHVCSVRLGGERAEEAWGVRYPARGPLI